MAGKKKQTAGQVIFLPAATFGAVRSTGAKVLDVGGGGFSRVKCPDEIRALVPPFPHFGGGGKLCPDKILMVQPLPHFFIC